MFNLDYDKIEVGDRVTFDNGVNDHLEGIYGDVIRHANVFKKDRIVVEWFTEENGTEQKWITTELPENIFVYQKAIELGK